MARSTDIRSIDTRPALTGTRSTDARSAQTHSTVPRFARLSLRSRRGATAFAVCLVVGVGLAGCSAPLPVPTSTPSVTATADDTAAPTAPAAPVLQPIGTATDNQPFFDAVITATLAPDPNPGGRGYIDALTAAGFDKAQMEVTADTTTKGEAADSIQFSVHFNGECIVGQNGPSSGGYHSMIAPLLGSGTCLVGATRQIDW